MQVGIKTKKVVEVNDVKEVDLDSMLNVLKKRINCSDSDEVKIPLDLAEDFILVLEECKAKENFIENFEEIVPKDIKDDLKSLALKMNVEEILNNIFQ